MKHGKFVKKLGRDPKHRWHMLRCVATMRRHTAPTIPHSTMVDQLIQHDRIVTTMPRAKVLRKFADRMVTLAKEVRAEERTLCAHRHAPQDTVTSRRRAGDVLRTEEAKFRLFTELKDRCVVRCKETLHHATTHTGTNTAKAATRAYSGGTSAWGTTPKWPSSSACCVGT